MLRFTLKELNWIYMIVSAHKSLLEDIDNYVVSNNQREYRIVCAIKRKLGNALSKSLDNKTMKNTRTLVLSSREKEHHPIGTLLVDVVEPVINDSDYGTSHKDSK